VNSAPQPAKVTLLCFAVKQEAEAFERLLHTLPSTRILLTGMGRRNAETWLSRALVGELPRLVVSAGFAGGLNPQFPSGAVLFSADPESNLDPGLRAAGGVAARFYCADRVAITAAEKKELRERTGADAVEMESQVIRDLCRKRGIPSATVRVILDAAGEELPLDFNALMDDELRLDSRKLALTVAKSPLAIARLLRFKKQVRAASQRLAAVLQHVLAGKGK
jgi:adenosylhomocysteine nucleosidase